MKRRRFTQSMGLLAAGMAIAPSYAGQSKKTTDRLTMSTVNFRERFAQTRSAEQNTSSSLTLLQVPGYFRDRFGLRLVEFWSKHFESLDMAYLKDLKAAINKSKSKLVNIQFDENYQIGSTDEEIRKKSLDLSMQWIEAAHYLGSGAFRVNPGNGDADLAIDSLKKINVVCKSKGLILMVENHFGIEMNPDVHLRIIKEVGDNIYTLPDYGNYDNDVRYDALRKIMPYAYQVSAKTMTFDDNMNHTSYDFDQCMKIAVDSGFKGIYSAEQWTRDKVTVSDEAMADWMLKKIKSYL